MQSPFFKVASQISKNLESWTPSSPLLKKVTTLQLGSNWLIQANNNVGATATALEFLYEFNKRGKEVFFFDIADSIFSHRVKDLDTSKIVIIRPHGPEELAGALKSLSKEERSPILIFDSLHLYRERDIWNLQYNLDPFLDHCYQGFDRPTVVATERTSFLSNRARWKDTLMLEYVEGWTVNQQKVGHIVNVVGKQGSARGYIDYNAGRFSKRYFQATTEVEQGKHPSTTFKFQDQIIRGLRNFVLNTDPIAEQ